MCSERSGGDENVSLCQTMDRLLNLFDAGVCLTIKKFSSELFMAVTRLDILQSSCDKQRGGCYKDEVFDKCRRAGMLINS